VWSQLYASVPTYAPQFLDDLERRLRPLGEKERATLLELKKEESARLGLPFDNEFYIWDYRYYDRLFIEKTLNLDDALVKQYFPVDVVVPSILNIYQDLLSVRFEKVEGEVWHSEAQMFAVWEKDAKDETGFVGWCYLDLFPRRKFCYQRTILRIVSDIHGLALVQRPNTHMLPSSRSAPVVHWTVRRTDGNIPSLQWLPISPSQRQMRRHLCDTTTLSRSSMKWDTSSMACSAGQSSCAFTAPTLRAISSKPRAKC
jgi:hypothetical protein